MARRCSRIANTDPPPPIRAFLNVNGMDNGCTAPEDGHHNWVLANQHMAAALKANGYHYRFVTAEGLGHCDARAWQSHARLGVGWVSDELRASAAHRAAPSRCLAPLGARKKIASGQRI